MAMQECWKDDGVDGSGKTPVCAMWCVVGWCSDGGGRFGTDAVAVSLLREPFLPRSLSPSCVIKINNSAASMLQAALSDDSICLAASRIRLSFLSLPSFSSPSSHNTADRYPQVVGSSNACRNDERSIRNHTSTPQKLFDPGTYCACFLLCRKLEILVIQKKIKNFTRFQFEVNFPQFLIDGFQNLIS